jgi:hypothetical protein
MAVVTTLGLTNSAYGVAAFARQTGLDCTSCHSAAGFPALSSFGAAFKAGGYVQGNEEKMVGDGEGLSIPEALNFGIVFKGRDKISVDGDGNYTNALQIPDEAALFAAGRIAKNVGFVIELGDAWYNSFKLVWVNDIGPVKLGIVPWVTDAFGSGWVFETLSTGNVRNIRVGENRSLVSAASATGWGGAGDASGLGLYVWHPMGFVAYSAFTPGRDVDIQDGMGHYVRAAATPSLDFGDIGVGVSYKGGSTSGEDGDLTYNWLGADAQLMLADIPLTAIVTYAMGLDSGADSAVTVNIDYAILENMLNANVSFRAGLSDGISNAVGGSIRYNIATNVRLSLDLEYDLDDSGLMVMPMISGSW